jgi:lincosamide nucleotidyltransferase A/C/D/E
MVICTWLRRGTGHFDLSCGCRRSRSAPVAVVAGQHGCGQTGAVNRRAAAQLRVIRAVTNALGAAGISAWLFGGWGLDARIGRITREHGDIEFWVERRDAGRSKAVLAGAGATALARQPPAEACEFTWDGVDFSTAYFDRQADGSFSQPHGRWPDWVFPPGSFGDEPVTLDGTPVLAMSISGMLAMKEQFPHLRNGRPWRQKDIDDIKTLRRLAGSGLLTLSIGDVVSRVRWPGSFWCFPAYRFMSSRSEQ